jgi:lysophospholipase L1-like esterase
MNPNPQAVRILCYGDSNTWGCIPGSQEQRFKPHERWTGILQAKLGEGYEIIEEGLNGRTTVIDHPTKSGRNGLSLLMPILETHHPLDMVVLMLGTNDLKTRYQRSPEQIAEGTQKLIDEIIAFAKKMNRLIPTVFLVSPPHIIEVSSNDHYRGSTLNSTQLAPLYQKIAHQTPDCFFINAAQHIQSSDKDGVHLEKSEHSKFAEVLYTVITQRHWARS